MLFPRAHQVVDALARGQHGVTFLILSRCEGQSAAEVVLGFDVGELHRGLLPGAQQIVQRAFWTRRALPVVGEDADLFVAAIRVQAFQRFGHPLVENRPFLLQQRVVCHVLDHMVFESVFRLWHGCLLDDQLFLFQDGKNPVEGMPFVVYGAEQSLGERPPDHGGELQDAFGGGGKPVDARHQHAVERVWDGDVGGFAYCRTASRAAIPEDDARVDERANQFFEVERVAFGVVEDAGFEVRWQAVHP